MSNSSFPELKIPEIAKGTVVPNSVEESILQKEQENIERKKERRREFLIATYGIIGGLIAGIISGVVSSLIVLAIQGLL